MLCDVTVTADEFKTIHNTLCKLDAMARSMDSGQMTDAIEQIREALRGAYDQDAAVFNERGSHYDAVRLAYNLNCRWSIYEAESLFHDHPWGDCKTVSFGAGSDRNYVPVNGSRWIDLYQAANRMLDGRFFIEGFRENPNMAGDLIISVGT